MRIGHYQLKNRILLAPMAGITDQPFRKICAHYGAGLTFSEMMSTNPQVWHTEKSKLRLAHHQDAGINAVQIAGSDPDEMAQAAQVNVEYGAQIIDINMGCPAKKVNRKMAGSALLQYPDLVQQILEAVVKSVNVPVTLKIRTGWDTENRNCVEIAKIAEQSGIQALTVHGRTRACKFEGVAEYDSIKAVKQAVSIPVIANGDVFRLQDYIDIRTQSGCDDVMLGRGAVMRPDLARQIRQYLHGEEVQAALFDDEIIVWIAQFIELCLQYEPQGKYAVARLKQWLGMMCDVYPEAESLFQAIRTLREIEPIRAHIRTLITRS